MAINVAKIQLISTIASRHNDPYYSSKWAYISDAALYEYLAMAIAGTLSWKAKISKQNKEIDKNTCITMEVLIRSSSGLEIKDIESPQST